MTINETALVIHVTEWSSCDSRVKWQKGNAIQLNLLVAETGNSMATSKTESNYSSDYMADRNVIPNSNNRLLRSSCFNGIKSNCF